MEGQDSNWQPSSPRPAPGHGVQTGSGNTQESGGNAAPSSADIWGLDLEARSSDAMTTLFSVGGFAHDFEGRSPFQENIEINCKGHDDSTSRLEIELGALHRGLEMATCSPSLPPPFYRVSFFSPLVISH